MTFDPYILSREDLLLARRYVPGEGEGLREPDLVIAPDGEPYIYRWHVTPRSQEANTYFHVQVADDPERPLHDHPWDNMSVILSGSYEEVLMRHPETESGLSTLIRNPGDVIFRKATEAHRLFLHGPQPYVMTQFSTGPHVRPWGFWFGDRWVDQKDVIEVLPDGRSIFKEPAN